MNYNKHTHREKRLSSINLLDNRIIYVDGEIDDEKAKDIIELLLSLDLQNHKEIKMYINSNGGAVTSGLAIYDTMNVIKSDISTICIGKCSSIASILLINGAKGKRFIMPNANVMLHEVSSFSTGKVGEMQNHLDHSKDLNYKLFRIIEEKSNMSYKKIKHEATGKDWWLTSYAAVKYGIVDKVLGGDSNVSKRHR